MTLRRSLKRQIAFLAGLILALYPRFALAAAPEAKPVVEITSPRQDAGSHWEGEVVSRSFEVRNVGTGELRILRVKPG